MFKAIQSNKLTSKLLITIQTKHAAASQNIYGSRRVQMGHGFRRNNKSMYRRRWGGAFLFIHLTFPPHREEWANPGGTAIPGRPVAKVEQAPDTSPEFKNQFNIEAPG